MSFFFRQFGDSNIEERPPNIMYPKICPRCERDGVIRFHLIFMPRCGQVYWFVCGECAETIKLMAAMAGLLSGDEPGHFGV